MAAARVSYRARRDVIPQRLSLSMATCGRGAAALVAGTPPPDTAAMFADETVPGAAVQSLWRSARNARCEAVRDGGGSGHAPCSYTDGRGLAGAAGRCAGRWRRLLPAFLPRAEGHHQ